MKILFKTLPLWSHFSRKNALRSAGLYTIHANRKIVTPKDIKLAMMLEVFIYTKRPDFIDKCKQIKQKLYENDNMNDEEDIEEEFITNDIEEYKESSCECVLCKSINDISPKWDSWNPQNKVEEILKKHINNIQ